MRDTQQNETIYSHPLPSEPQTRPGYQYVPWSETHSIGHLPGEFSRVSNTATSRPTNVTFVHIHNKGDGLIVVGPPSVNDDPTWQKTS